MFTKLSFAPSQLSHKLAFKAHWLWNAGWGVNTWNKSCERTAVLLLCCIRMSPYESRIATSKAISYPAQFPFSVRLPDGICSESKWKALVTLGHCWSLTNGVLQGQQKWLMILSEMRKKKKISKRQQWCNLTKVCVTALNRPGQTFQFKHS